MQTLLASMTSKKELEDLITEPPYTVDTVKMLRESLPSSGLQRGWVLDFAADILVDAWECDPDKAGKMATLLSQTWLGWHPEITTILDLVRLCEEAMDEGKTSMVAVLQPAAYVLGVLGYQEWYDKWLRTTITEEKWRAADLQRNTESYYASGKEKPRENQLDAIDRHLGDPNRPDKVKPHDAGLLVQIRVVQDAEGLGSDHPEVERAKAPLRQIVKIFEEQKKHELVAYVRQLCGI
jgi:hypothetical protein